MHCSMHCSKTAGGNVISLRDMLIQRPLPLMCDDLYLFSFSSNRYYLPAPTASVSVGSTSISPASSSSPSATITDVLSLLAKQMQTHMLPFDIWYACTLHVSPLVYNARDIGTTAFSGTCTCTCTYRNI